MPRSPPNIAAPSSNDDDEGHTANGMFFSINCLIFSLGLYIFLYGLRYLSTFLQLLDVMPNSLAELHVLVAAGLAAIDMATAVLGVLAFLLYNKHLMWVYAILLPLNGIAEALMSWHFMTRTTAVLRNKLTTMARRQWEHREEEKKFWKDTQMHFRCCGLNGPKDWAPKGSRLPNECCVNKHLKKFCEESRSYSDGCAKQLSNYSGITTFMVVLFICILVLKVFNLMLWWFVS